uniref:Ovule protein n=1 Tax=Ascaris lumbricoides TaxID=6252 RepID=A0A0M3IUU4_ASCLU
MAEDSSISLESHKNSNEVKAGDGMVVTSFEDEDSCKYGELILLGFVLFLLSEKNMSFCNIRVAQMTIVKTFAPCAK